MFRNKCYVISFHFIVVVAVDDDDDDDDVVVVSDCRYAKQSIRFFSSCQAVCYQEVDRSFNMEDTAKDQGPRSN